VTKGEIGNNPLLDPNLIIELLNSLVEIVEIGKMEAEFGDVVKWLVGWLRTT